MVCKVFADFNHLQISPFKWGADAWHPAAQEMTVCLATKAATIGATVVQEGWHRVQEQLSAIRHPDFNLLDSQRHRKAGIPLDQLDADFVYTACHL